MVAELAQALRRQPNRGDVGQADRDRPAEHTYERAVLLCVSSAGSQLRIRDHQLCRCAQEVDGKTATQSTFTVAPSNSCGVLNSLLSRLNAKAYGIGTLKILNPFGPLKILLPRRTV